MDVSMLYCERPYPHLCTWPTATRLCTKRERELYSTKSSVEQGLSRASPLPGMFAAWKFCSRGWLEAESVAAMAHPWSPCAGNSREPFLQVLNT
jgi:hypothetical protein